MLLFLVKKRQVKYFPRVCAYVVLLSRVCFKNPCRRESKIEFPACCLLSNSRRYPEPFEKTGIHPKETFHYCAYSRAAFTRKTFCLIVSTYLTIATSFFYIYPSTRSKSNFSLFFFYSLPSLASNIGRKLVKGIKTNYFASSLSQTTFISLIVYRHSFYEMNCEERIERGLISLLLRQPSNSSLPEHFSLSRAFLPISLFF